MDQNTRTNIISAAVIAAGPASNYADPGAHQAAIHEQAVSIAVMSSDTSQIAKTLASIENAKVFTGTVLLVKKEASSTRGIVTVHTKTPRVKEGVPEGCEQVRTDRTDNALGLAMAQKIKGLVGHKILMWVEIEEYNGGQGKVRVIKHCESLGVDAEFAEKSQAA